VSASGLPNSFAVDSSARFAYATEVRPTPIGYDGSILRYTVGPDGRLKLEGSGSFVLAGPTSGVIHPSGKYFYATVRDVVCPLIVLCFDRAQVFQFEILAGSGELMPLDPELIQLPVLNAIPSSSAVHPSGRYAYVGTSGGNVWQFMIGASGALASMTPNSVAAGGGASSIAFDPAGKYAYVANKAGNTVSQFRIGSDGALEPLSPAAIQVGTGPSSVTVDASGKYAYVANEGGNVSQYEIAADGKLAPMTPATIAAGTNPVSVVTVAILQ